MKFIKPSEISSKIMTLIEESDEFVILVSPYVKISKWYKLIKKLEKLDSRNIPVEFIIRDDETNQRSFQELNDLGIRYSAIKDLHCKLYINEKYAIVSSMNLLLSSEINSLELAYQTENDIEYQELKEFCERYLSIDFDKTNVQNEPFNMDWKDHVCNYLREKNGTNIWVEQQEGAFLVNTGINNYTSFILSEKQNYLRMSGILSRKEFEFLKYNKSSMPLVEGLKLELIDGKTRHYDTIWATSEKPLNSYDLNNVYDNEKPLVAEQVTNFIIEIDNFKKWARQNI
jgi:hypothetical protein